MEQDTYTVMNSAGPLLKTHSVEAAAMSSEQLVNNNTSESNGETAMGQVPSNVKDKPEDRYVSIH